MALLLSVMWLGALAPVQAQPAALRAVVGDRIVLNGSLKMVAPAPAAGTVSQAAAVVRPVLTQAELAQELSFEVGLSMRDLPLLHKRVAAGEILSRAKLDADHLPSQAEFDKVANWLTSQGFTITRRDGHRLALFAKGTLTQIQQAFQTKFSQVAFEGQNYLSIVTAPSVPATLPAILGVTGLQPFQKARTFSRPFVTPAINNAPPYLVKEIMGAFDAGNTKLTGKGQEIGIIIDAVPLSDDLTKFYQANNSTQTVNNVFVENTPNYDNAHDLPGGEETLDVSWSSTVAPAATVTVFCTGDLSWANLDGAYSTIADELANGQHPNLHQLSMSYGADEDFTDPDEISQEEQYYATIAGYGVTILASSGDNGAFDYDGGYSVSYPASDPSITAVGGTTVVLNHSTGAVSSITGWSDDGQSDFGNRIGSSGGGISEAFYRPDWQKGVGVPDGDTRCVPDISASADQNEAGLLVLTYKGTQYTYAGANGTSWAAPTWAGLIALINQARSDAGLPPLGLLNPKIYPLLQTASFRDITSGSNGHYGESDGYACTTGYDLVTGIGTPSFANLVTALVPVGPTISSFSPATGKVGDTVIIDGTGFSNVTSVVFGGNKPAYGSFTSTRITVTVPSGALTGPITVTTSNGKVSTASNFTVITGFTLKVTALNGTVTENPAQSTYASGTSVQLTATPASGYRFSGWSGDAGGSSNPLTITMNSNKDITANFVQTATLQVVASPAAGGKVTGAGTFAVGSTQTITATANSGYRFTGWSDGNTQSTRSVTVVSGGSTYTANFLPPPVITSALSAGGIVGKTFGYRIGASNGPKSFDATNLPPGLTIDTVHALISGTPTKAGTYSTTISATNPAGTGSATLTITISVPAPVITSAATDTGTVGQTFGYRILASNSPTSFNATGLPSGLTVDKSSALISGTPTKAGSYSVTLSATNGTGTGSQTLKLTIDPVPTPAITSATTKSGVVGTSLTYRISASNHPTSFNATGLPPGLTVDTSTALISGTPTKAGTYSATITATNSTGTGQATLTFTINLPAPVIISATSKTSIVGTAFSYRISATNSPKSFSATSLPAGLSVDTSTGLISGTPTKTGTFSVPITATNATGTGKATLTITIEVPKPDITSALTKSGKVGTALTYRISASNHPTSFNATGLPPGLTVDPSTALISGTPTKAGAYSTAISATNGTGTGTATLKFTIN